MEGVLTRYSVKGALRCMLKGRGKPSRLVYQRVTREDSRAEGLEGKECVAGCLREYSGA